MNELKSSALWPIILIVSAVAVPIVLVTSVATPVRAAATFWFLLVCPGMAFIPLFEVESPLIQATMAIALSIALCTIVSEAMLFFDVWSPWLGIMILASVIGTGAVLQGVQVYRAGGPRTG